MVLTYNSVTWCFVSPRIVTLLTSYTLGILGLLHENSVYWCLFVGEVRRVTTLGETKHHVTELYVSTHDSQKIWGFEINNTYLNIYSKLNKLFKNMTTTFLNTK